MTAITSPIRLARPSAAVSRALTDAERVAMQSPGLSLVSDPGERAYEFAGLALRDRIGARVGTVFSGAPGLINSRPGISFLGQGGTNVGCRYNYVLPRSYFMAAVLSIADLTNTSAIVSGGAGDAQHFFGVMNTGAIRVHHGNTNGFQSANGSVADGTHVIWASYDHTSGAVEIGRNAVTALASSTIAVEHSAASTTWTWGGTSGLWGVNGVGGPVVIVDRPLLGVAAEARRLSVLAWLAEYGGVSLAA